MTSMPVLCLLVLEGLLCLFFLWRRGLLEGLPRLGLCVLLTVLAFSLRWAVLDYETLDYQNFLTHWVSFFREKGGFRALRYPVGNYNIPYLYFLALFSCFEVRDLYLIKLLSIFFDVLLAGGAMALLSKFTGSKNRLTSCFFAVLFLPTVFLNGSLWAQCDSSYTALAVWSLAFALDDKPCRSVIAMTLSFGFKLQAVFVMPVLAVFWMAKKLKLRHFLLFPLSYVLLVLPAVLLGRPFWDTITLYFNQTGSIGSGLNYNSPSVFAFFWNVADEAAAAKWGILAAFAFMLLVLGLCFFFRRRLGRQALLAAALLLSLGIPFLLPHMHDRYFFLADILSLVLAFALPWTSPAAALCQFASLLGYHAYLKMRYLLLMDRGAAALILALGIAFAALFSGFRKEHENNFLSGLDNPG